MSPSLTVNAGVRWEYEAPITERFGRLVNLDIAPGFTAVSPVVADDPIGVAHRPALSRLARAPGQERDSAAPRRRVAAGARLVAGRPRRLRHLPQHVVYQSIATLLAQQPPLSTAFSVENSAANPLTLANGFVAPPGATLNTFAVDPDFRVGYAQNWQVSVQRDLPASLTVMATYLGTKGSRLMQEFLPNTYPAGAVNPCADLSGRLRLPDVERHIARGMPASSRCAAACATASPRRSSTRSRRRSTMPRRSAGRA